MSFPQLQRLHADTADRFSVLYRMTGESGAASRPQE
jgi:hypothetical protein